ncbi:Uncharacterised protein [Mycobacteroides abscessus subsp. abscessus]|nr:Uncharacterised protein [Mycobacteroides abscessus subsp. abscessus]
MYAGAVGAGCARNALLALRTISMRTASLSSDAMVAWPYCSRETGTSVAILPVAMMTSRVLVSASGMASPSGTNAESSRATNGTRTTGASPSTSPAWTEHDRISAEAIRSRGATPCTSMRCARGDPGVEKIGEDMAVGFLRRQSHADNKFDVSRRPQAQPVEPALRRG